MADTALTLPRVALGAGSLKLAGDDRLADLAAAGDERAFTLIFERHHQALYRYCRSILGNGEDAADALQNTMLRALRALPGEKRTIALKPWLFRIAHNEAISLVRRRRPQVSVEDEALGLQSAGPDVDSDMRERVEHLFEDLRELPERQRSALIMRELSGLSYDEIAAALHTSTGAAAQAVFGARKALHEFAEGRDTRCEEIEREISRRDGRILASRKIRAHLRKCAGCTAFRAMIDERERGFAALAPPMPAVAAAAILQGLQGGGGVGGGGLGGLTGSVGSSHAVISAAALKAAPMLVAAAVGAGAGALTQSGVSRVTAPGEAPAAIRALAERVGSKAHAAAAVLALRNGVEASPAAASGGGPRAGSEPASGTLGDDGPPLPASGETAPASGSVPTTGADPVPGAERPASRAPSSRDPSQGTTPTGQRTPATGSPTGRPAPSATSTPRPPSATTPTAGVPAATPPSTPPPTPAPTTTPPPPPPVSGDEPDDDTDDRPKKPRPCRPSPPPRGHPDGPCPA